MCAVLSPRAVAAVTCGKLNTDATASRAVRTKIAVPNTLSVNAGSNIDRRFPTGSSTNGTYPPTFNPSAYVENAYTSRLPSTKSGMLNPIAPSARLPCRLARTKRRTQITGDRVTEPLHVLHRQRLIKPELRNDVRPQLRRSCWPGEKVRIAPGHEMQPHEHQHAHDEQ